MQRYPGVVAALVALAWLTVACSDSSVRGADVAPSRDPATTPAPTTPAPTTPAVTTTGPPTGGCGSVPRSSGPLTMSAELALDAPASARSAGRVQVRTNVVARRDFPRTITTPPTSLLLLTDGDVVVARTEGSTGLSAIPLALATGAVRVAQAVPASLELVSCDGSSTPVAAGQYGLVAVLGYGGDPLNSVPAAAAAAPTPGRAFVLVSEPVTIIVEA